MIGYLAITNMLVHPAHESSAEVFTKKFRALPWEQQHSAIPGTMKRANPRARSNLSACLSSVGVKEEYRGVLVFLDSTSLEGVTTHATYT